MADTPKRRPRRRFDDDFKAQAVRLVLDEGKSVGSVARDLDLTETALHEWVKRALADRTNGKTGLTTAGVRSWLGSGRKCGSCGRSGRS
jgi:transposase